MADSIKTPSGFHRKLAQVLGNWVGSLVFFSGHKELWPGLEPLPPAAYLPDGKFIESGFNLLGLKGMNTAQEKWALCFYFKGLLQNPLPKIYIHSVVVTWAVCCIPLISVSAWNGVRVWRKPLYEIPVISRSAALGESCYMAKSNLWFFF